MQTLETSELLKRLTWLKNKLIEADHISDDIFRQMEVTLLSMQFDMIVKELEERNIIVEEKTKSI